MTARAILFHAKIALLAGLVGTLPACSPEGAPLTQKAPTMTQENAHQSVAPKVMSGMQFEGLTGGVIDLASFRGKVVLVVNTASQCGYTGQYAGLETLYQARKADGLVILGVPSNDFGGQEPGSADQIKDFCEINYGVTFPLAAKSVVKGPNAHPFYRNAVDALGPTAQPAWNFHKVLVGKDGVPIKAFASGVAPNAAELETAIDAALAS
jgi:glutathione peroxidase